MADVLPLLTLRCSSCGFEVEAPSRPAAALLARQEVPQLQIVQIPPELSVGADYGLMVLDGAPAEAWRLAMFILAPQGQGILAEYGFVAVGVPSP